MHESRSKQQKARQPSSAAVLFKVKNEKLSVGFSTGSSLFVEPHLSYSR
jgi:hypothetical protein